MSKRQSKQIVDVGGGIPALSAYAFLGVAGTATLTGFFVNSSGYQVGTVRSFSFVIGNGTNDPVCFTDIPESAIGFVGDIDADVYWSTGAHETVLLQNMKASYASYPTLTADTGMYFGAVSVD